jgi:uncharacterized protein (DUF305 family)
MKNSNLICFAVVGAVLLSACNPSVKEHDSQKKETAAHEMPADKNVMLAIMDDSMMEMHHVKQTGNADYDFAAMMVPHHEGAVKMAEAVISSGKSPELIAFAHKVIEAQDSEIKTFKAFLKTADQQPSKDAEKAKAALNNSMNAMMEGMNFKPTNHIDQDFVALMIPHHQSAVDMAKAYLPYAKNRQIRQMALQILKAQEEEINWLKTL